MAAIYLLPSRGTRDVPIYQVSGPMYQRQPVSFSAEAGALPRPAEGAQKSYLLSWPTLQPYLSAWA
jgi:hypothetical protein